MLMALESKTDIRDAQERFETAFTPYVDDRYRVDIGYQGGFANRQIIWMPSFDLWAHFGDPPSEKGPPNRYWNVFGIGRPSGMVSIVCEINPPKGARRYPPAGAFAENRAGKLHVLHRGKLTVSGGITIDFVKRHLNAEWVSFVDGGNTRDAILVARVPSESFGLDIQQFVVGIHRVKELARKANQSPS